MSKVIVTLDGSEVAEQALPVAQKLAGDMNAELVLLTVTELPETSAQAETIRRDAEAGLQRSAQRLSTTGRIRIEQAGDPVRGILHAVDEERPDLLVMTTHGRSGLSALTQGSVADGVVRSGRVPVVLYRPKAADDD